MHPFITAGVAIAALSGIYLFLISAPFNFPNGAYINIPTGSSITSAAETLKDKGVIRSTLLFRASVYLFGEDRHVVAGEYFFPSRKNVFTIAGRLGTGDFEVDPARVRIPEGATLSDIAKHVWNHAPNNGIVYDYSMGFGQRMIGALATKKGLTYVATDPWKTVVEQNNNIASFLKMNDKVKLFCEGAENFCPDEYKGKIDLIFSSPPYFDKEIYDNETQKVATNNSSFYT
jgi:cell division protein YceG involved in septum cleavage